MVRAIAISIQGQADNRAIKAMFRHTAHCMGMVVLDANRGQLFLALGITATRIIWMQIMYQEIWFDSHE